MKNGGIGVGSASIVLVFAVLCLTVFSIITFLIAGNGKALVDAEAKLVVGYYKADTIAENVVAEIIGADTIPDNVLGIDITSDWNFESGAETAHFTCPISELKELYVCIAKNGNSYDILSWQMLDIGQWEFDDSLNVWQGDDGGDIGGPMDVWSEFDQWAE